MEKKPTVSLQNVVPLMYNSPISSPLSWQIFPDECWTIIGNNGAGKSTLVDILKGKYNLREGEMSYHFENIGADERPQSRIKVISFNSVYSISDFRDSYYQQRFNHTENEFTPRVCDLFSLEEFADNAIVSQLLKPLMEKFIVQLSSGELRKILIARVLTEKPALLIFDNPFIGLDASSHELLEQLFPELQKSGIQLMFVVPSKVDIPRCTTHLLTVENGGIKSAEIYRSSEMQTAKIEKMPKIDWGKFPKSKTECNIVVEMHDLEISYGKRIINDHINWTVKSGEKWTLLGPNGSGKSTLLSYIFADNPKAYTKNISLFDRKRGTGESIWDIKKRIGFTSSEMHLYYRENISCLNVVKSGFFDSVGLFKKCTLEQDATAEYICNLLNLNRLKDKLFLRTSAGEQRMVLFARALVKNPELLVLDEPFHGLDDRNKRLCIETIEQFCEQPKKSLILVTHYMGEIPPCINNCMKLSPNKSH